MRLCEQNYVRLLPLLRALGDDDQALFTLPGPGGGEVEMHIRVLERCRYTSVLRLEQEAVHALLPRFRLTVRLYHDVRSAEVTESLPFRRVSARHEYPNRCMHQRDEKSQWNRFLADWLAHLHKHGRSGNGLDSLWLRMVSVQR